MKRSELSSPELSQRSNPAVVNGARYDGDPPPGEDSVVAQKAAVYCVLHFPTLWTARLPRWDAAARRWVVPVVVRYPTGDEGELGDLAFDGHSFTLLTTHEEMARRARAIEQDPAFQHRWHEQFPSAVPPGTA
jgi:hypothetical protein